MIAESVTGAILAGGPNTGMSGKQKALLKVSGEALIQRQIRIMREVCAEIIVITNTPKPFFELLDPSVRIITDYFPGCGPLGGMHAALYLARNPLVWMAGCDMPMLSAEAARRLLDRRTESCQSVVPIIRSQPLPLHAIYDKKCAEAAAKLLADGEKGLTAFLGHIKWLGISADNWTKEAGIGDFDYTIHNQVDYEHAHELLIALDEHIRMAE
jgi:molybdopterin-guanine dinucleotide biosynthesis protein A